MGTLEMQISAMVWRIKHKTCCTLTMYFLSDIDECALNATLCEQLCINTDGSYTCACNEGHQLIEGTNQCQGDRHSSY